MKKTAYATPMLEMISVSEDDIIRTSGNKTLGLLDDDQTVAMPTLPWIG